MLTELLQAIHSGGTLEVSSLAKRLGTTPELVRAMLEHLQRTGTLHPYAACQGACAGCGLASDCHTDGSDTGVRLWQG